MQKVFDKNKLNEKWIDISLLLEKESLYMNELDKIAEIFDKNIKVIALKNSGITKVFLKIILPLQWRYRFIS